MSPLPRRQRDRRRAAELRARTWQRPVVLRRSEPSDRAQLTRLAELEGRPLPIGPHLVAEREGRIEAAISLAGRELRADPFVRTAELCELLRCYAGEQNEPGDPSPSPGIGALEPALGSP